MRVTRVRQPSKSSEPKPTPKASGINIPEAQRHTVAVKLRLKPEVAERLDEIVAAWGSTRSEAVARLIGLCRAKG